MKGVSCALAAVVLAALVAEGCSSSEHATSSDAMNLTSGTCTVVSVKDARPLTPDELQALRDPVANLILTQGNCPLTLSEIQAKLNTTDPCSTARGLSTSFVSDRAQLLDHPDTYRAVLSRQCQGRSSHELLLSVFGISTHLGPDGNIADVQVPQTRLELIGEQRPTGRDDGDPNTGVFNFYAREDGQWKFFGSSRDFLAQGYDCNSDGACIPKAATQIRCAACHVGGSPLMKELDSPWNNWESTGTGGTMLPGAEDVATRNRDLFGDLSGGQNLEGKVRGAVSDWTPARLTFLKSLGTKEVLRPLFCATDLNLLTSGIGEFQVRSELFVDSTFPLPGASIGGVVDGDVYASVLKETGQRIVDGRTGNALVVDGHPVADTFFPFVIPIRSAQDEAYVEELQHEGVADSDFVKDVLSIDFTRPVFSALRCRLLDAAPDLAAEDMTAAKLKAAFIAKLASSSEPVAMQLVANLRDPSDGAKHDEAAVAFLDACRGRASSEPLAYTRDLVRYASHLRRAARRARNPTNGGVIEFAETLPADNLPETTSEFDPKTCKLP
jgi:hypothetical protein